MGAGVAVDGGGGWHLDVGPLHHAAGARIAQVAFYDPRGRWRLRNPEPAGKILEQTQKTTPALVYP